MTPAKKKGSSRTVHRKTKPCPPAAAPPVQQVPIPPNAVAVPAPVLTPTQRKLFSVVTKQDAIGFILAVVGLTLLFGFVLSDKEHLHDIIVLIVGSVFTLVGFLMMDLKNMGSALKELATHAIPFVGKKSDPTPPAGGA